MFREVAESTLKKCIYSTCSITRFAHRQWRILVGAVLCRFIRHCDATKWFKRDKNHVCIKSLRMSFVWFPTSFDAIWAFNIFIFLFAEVSGSFLGNSSNKNVHMLMLNLCRYCMPVNLSFGFTEFSKFLMSSRMGNSPKIVASVRMKIPLARWQIISSRFNLDSSVPLNNLHWHRYLSSHRAMCFIYNLIIHFTFVCTRIFFFASRY